MKTRFKGNVPRTSDGWQSQWKYDELLSDLDPSSLCFLNDDYKYRIREFPLLHDLNNPDDYREYKNLLQRKQMIKEELDFRLKNLKPEKYFDSATGIVVDEYGHAQYSIAFTEDEDDIIYNHTMNSSSDAVEIEDDETDYTYYKYHNRNERYKEWNYIRELDEEDKQD